tara:strand:+ start:1506 stop:2651 length:1146 start_codon:yes stop_codon:yes gene_type:complete
MIGFKGDVEMRKVEFGEIATFSQGLQVSIPDQKNEKFDDCDTFLRIVNYTSNSDDFRYIPKQNHKHHVSTDDIIMVRYGAVGFVGRGLSGVLANNMFKINFDKDQLDGNYLFRALWSDFVQKQLLNASQSTSMPAINFKTTSKITIPLPPMDQQKKIAAILDAADAYRQKTKELITKYDELTQSLFLDMFGDYLNGDKKPLKELVKFSQGQQFGVELQLLEPQNGYARFLRIVDFTQGDDLRYVPNQSEKHYVKSDDIVIVRYGSSAGFVGTNKEGVLANNLFKVNYDRTTFHQLFLFHIFQHGRFKAFIKKEAFGAAMPALSFKVMERFEIPVPTIELQNQFADRVQAVEAQKAQAQASLAQAEDLFNSLLQRAFKGDLV